MRPSIPRAVPLLHGIFAASLIASSALTAGCEPGRGTASHSSAKPELGLVTSLPIFWQESEEFGDILEPDAEPSWVRSALEQTHQLRPLDNLSEVELAPLDRLLLAQPRALSPEENVALDDWVRGGGKLLLFADPLLTQHSRFALGDARAPQSVALLSPILARWGLEMTFDEDQAEGERIGDVYGYEIPVNLAGRFRLIEGDVKRQCDVGSEGLWAYCSIGKGAVWLVADAAALDTTVASDDARKAAVSALFERSFSP
ncbi:Gldg family protein [Erythrobacter sp. W53]|uniref:Gldg family protein n=1 Tax=Erythrobacter sp. W53 TaxID=3425947 RepID=UPI003D7667FE